MMMMMKHHFDGIDVRLSWENYNFPYNGLIKVHLDTSPCLFICCCFINYLDKYILHYHGWN